MWTAGNKPRWHTKLMDATTPTDGDDGTGIDSETTGDRSRRSVLKTLGIGAAAVTTGVTVSSTEAEAYFENFEYEEAPGNYSPAGSRYKKVGPLVLKYGHRIRYELVGGGTRRVRVTLSNGNRVIKRQTFTVSGSGTFTIWSRRNGHDITIERA